MRMRDPAAGVTDIVRMGMCGVRVVCSNDCILYDSCQFLQFSRKATLYCMSTLHMMVRKWVE